MSTTTTTKQNNTKVEPTVFSDAYPEFPTLMYNHETRQIKAAADKDAKAKLAEQGFVDEPLPPEDADALTPPEVEQLQALLAKAAEALAKLGKLSEHEPKEPAKKG